MTTSPRRGQLLLALPFLCAFVGANLEQVAIAEQDLLGDAIIYSGATLNLRPYATMPAAYDDVISITTRRGDQRLYVASENGAVFVINEHPTGTTTPVLWFDAAAAVQAATGRLMDHGSGQTGLQSVAFHPDFDQLGTAGYGKLYTTMLERRPANPQAAEFFYLGNSINGGVNADGVLAEWTFNHDAGTVDAHSYRELFRTNMPIYDHPIKQAKFNPYADPGDGDYGLLYLTHGDSNLHDSLNDDPQNLGNVLGKMLRIDPLQSGASRYRIPATNPFAESSNPEVLGEVYAYGFRNPHTFSFNPDAAGEIHILVGDIGRSNVEEVNLVTAGQNFGWTKREGTFMHLQGNNFPADPGPDNAGYLAGVAPLPANEASLGVDAQGSRYTYPVAQYDHNGENTSIGKSFTATAIATGFVIRNSNDPALLNQFVFGNFAQNHGDMYHTDFDSMRAAVTQLDPNDPLRDEPDELTQALKYKLHLTLDEDGDPETPPLTVEDDNLHDLLGLFRSDFRIGEGVFGEMYISTKSRGIYLVTNTMPLAGDYNRDGTVNGADLIVWSDQAGSTGYQLAADGDGNARVDGADFLVWQRQLGTNSSPALLGVPESPTLTMLVAGFPALLFSKLRPSRPMVVRSPDKTESASQV